MATQKKHRSSNATVAGKQAGRSKTMPKSRKQPIPRLVIEQIHLEPHRDTLDNRQTLAMEWAYRVRNRQRWLPAVQDEEDIGEEAVDALKAFGVDETKLETLAGADVIEIVIPYLDEPTSWPSRIFPWEHVIVRAMRHAVAVEKRSVIVRRLEPEKGEVSRRRLRGKFLFVDTCPGRLAGAYDFRDEADQLRRIAEVAKWKFERLHNPTLMELQECSAEADIVHITGIDSWYGDSMLRATDGKPQSPPTPRDGIWLSDSNGQQVCCDAKTLAQAFAHGQASPALLTLNVDRSASRIAPLCVAAGVRSAIGFQDSFNDSAKEYFFSRFFAELALGQKVGPSFQGALDALMARDRVPRGSGVVVWSREPFPQPLPTSPRKDVIWNHKMVQDAVSVRVQLPSHLNYSRIHNGENLIESFEVRKNLPGLLRGVLVEVQLRIGPETYDYRARHDVELSPTPLEDEIRVALSWQLLNGLRESVSTTIWWRVSWQEAVIDEGTRCLDILTVDEWRDDDVSGPWLPSFVLPRDPAILRIVDAARRYLRVLADDAVAGFDGYQRVESTEEEDIDDELATVIDDQVRAIWCALLHDFQIGYINPPPSFVDSSQRLRSPSQIIESHQGTCIDLALLLCSCLEYIGVNPVLFLLDGHCFAGYWRTEDTLGDLEASEMISRMRKEQIEGLTPDDVAWRTPTGRFEEVRQLLERGRLVPIEATCLTTLESFRDAVEEGRANLDSKRSEEFHSMLDVATARQANVTPLPF